MGLVNKMKILFSDKVSIVTKATLWFFMCSLLQKCTSLITIPIFTRIMTTEQMGEYTTYITWLQVFTILTTLRLDYGVFNKGMSKYSDDRDGYASSMLGITTILTTILLLLYLILKDWINNITDLNTTVSLAIFFELYTVPAINFWTLKQRYEYKYKSVVLITLLMTLSNVLLGVGSVFIFEDKGIARIISCILVNSCFGIVIYIKTVCKSNKLINLDYSKFALLFNIPLIPHYFSTYILEQSDKIMIRKLVGISETGVYGIACSIALVMKMVTSSISNALVPWQYQQIEKKNFKDISKRVYMMIYITAILVMGFIAIAPELMAILTTSEYYDAIYVIPPVSCSVIFILFFGLLANVEFYYEKNKFTMYVSLLSAGLNIGMNYICIILFNYIAVAYSTFICYIISSLLHLKYVNKLVYRKEGLSLFSIKQFLVILFLIISEAVIMSILYSFPYIRYLFIIICILCMIIFRKKLIKIINIVRNIQ